MTVSLPLHCPFPGCESTSVTREADTPFGPRYRCDLCNRAFGAIPRSVAERLRGPNRYLFGIALLEYCHGHDIREIELRLGLTRATISSYLNIAGDHAMQLAEIFEHLFDLEPHLARHNALLLQKRLRKLPTNPILPDPSLPNHAPAPKDSNTSKPLPIFFGIYEVTVDEDRRVVIPHAHRRAMVGAQELVIGPAPNSERQRWYVFTVPGHTALVSRLRERGQIALHHWYTDEFRLVGFQHPQGRLVLPRDAAQQFPPGTRLQAVGREDRILLRAANTATQERIQLEKQLATISEDEIEL
ncbi:MAG: transposase [Candidatus Zipacnadales bacterium]